MIPRSRGVAITALTLAAATHVLALHDFSAGETVNIEGGGSGEVAALGDSFKDYVTGATASAPSAAHQLPVTPTQQQPTVTPTSQAEAIVPQTISPTAPNSATAVAVTSPQKPVEPEAATAPEPQPKRAAVSQPEDVTPPEPAQQKVNQIASKKGNSEKSAKKGSASGNTSKGAATAKETKSKSAGQGNAQASNYAGHVKRKITRARRKSVNVRGAALVSFRIGDNGGLLSVSITRSSGSKRLDQVALAQVRAAAPFQPPPAAARRDYTIEIVGK
ncbi:TonB family protein [Ruegeria sp. Ofav3-42]|uniref:TonB family protein n=1 Tax=Ruegeria sp. Ofav3-42 TaxID=2917759 RepID=UPI001EF58170|nr:TonB family protein [Ruegeria sp. Ofav3-42]MCG7519043.1 TonB family protein [Ruegeria sp. Ofav3-42]